jgi:hypothetical protein
VASIAGGVLVVLVVGLLLWIRWKDSKKDDPQSQVQNVGPAVGDIHSTMLDREVVESHPGKSGSTKIDVQPPNLKTVDFKREVFQGSDVRVSLLPFFDRFGRSCFCGYNSWKGRFSLLTIVI